MSYELYHHGIKGQRWGVRRYQNSDGSLTAEGYQHWGLNPDGSKFRGKTNGAYTDATASASRKGLVIGSGVGATVGLLAGPVGASVGSMIGSLSGAAIGTIAGTINTRAKQRKIRKLLNEKGKVYVSDL